MKVSLRLANVFISEIDRSGLVTIKFREPVYLINDGTRIEPQLLTVSYLKNSEEDVKLTKWELVNYKET